jgi:thymidylate synthase
MVNPNYEEHIENAKLQIERKPFHFPKVFINSLKF